MSYWKFRRGLIFIVAIALLLSGCNLGAENKDPVGTNENPAVEPTEEPVADGPVVAKDLSNIENLEQFPELGDEHKAMLAENGFFVAPTKEEQLFYIYEYNEYEDIPSFITTDSVLQVYHIFFD